jgi:hypothetical protein
MRGVNLPQTFERRGTTVPFQQKDFAHARVREYFHGEQRQLEAVLPNFSGARRGEQLVLPWPQLADMGSLNARDAAVHEEVMATMTTRDLDPIAIREICIGADAQFAVDTQTRNKARQAAEQEDEDRMMVRLSCIAELTRECGIHMGDKLMSRTDTQTLLDLMSGETSRTKIDLNLLIERVMIFAAERSGTTVADAKSYLDPLVGMITPFGNVTAKGETKTNGFLYLQHTDLITFRKQVAEVQPTVREELETSMVLILEAADECIGYVNERLSDLNGMLGQLADMFDKNMNVIDRLDRLRRDVAYGLDGWVDMIRLWDEAYVAREAIGGELAMERAINRISGYAPRIPVKELYPDHQLVKKGSEYERARVRNVNQLHGWDTDQLDSELADRVEKGKERESDRKVWKSPEAAQKEVADLDAQKRRKLIKKSTGSTPTDG